MSNPPNWSFTGPMPGIHVSDEAHARGVRMNTRHTLAADFNGISPDNRVWARSEAGGGPLPLGIVVTLDDGEGLRCQARLVKDAVDWKGDVVPERYIAEIIPDTYEDTPSWATPRSPFGA